ncbi:hypothetical protein CPL00134L_CDS0021 [Escherichia phage Phagiculus]
MITKGLALKCVSLYYLPCGHKRGATPNWSRRPSHITAVSANDVSRTCRGIVKARRIP